MELLTKRLLLREFVWQELAEARIADVGYELDPNFWGVGYATEAATAVLNFGFAELKVHRIWANAVAENIASLRVLEKIGMQPVRKSA